MTVRGPLEKEHWVRPPNYERFFPGTVPDDPAERRAYARELLKTFATQAFRRPVDDADGRPARHARREPRGRAGADLRGRRRPGDDGRPGVAAVPVPRGRGRRRPRPARTRSSTSTPWPRGCRTSSGRRCRTTSCSASPARASCARTCRRRSSGCSPTRGRASSSGTSSASGSRPATVDAVQINARAVISRDEAPDPEGREAAGAVPRTDPQAAGRPHRGGEEGTGRRCAASFGGGFRRFAQFELNGDLRRAMRRETEMLFEHILRKDRSLLELIDSDYTFLNERLAKHYGIAGVTGDEMRLVKLPAGQPARRRADAGDGARRHVEPDRTSPVKRGLFILDNILGTPPPPAAAGHPVAGGRDRAEGRSPRRLRESLKAHRADALCSSCHNRMDPLGLALENFNALGMWRDKERGQPIDAAGKLITGEPFTERPRAEAHPGDRAHGGLLPLPDREAADLRPRPRPRVLRRAGGRRDRRAARGGEGPAVGPAGGHHRIGPVPETPAPDRSTADSRADRASDVDTEHATGP